MNELQREILGRAPVNGKTGRGWFVGSITLEFVSASPPPLLPGSPDGSSVQVAFSLIPGLYPVV